MNDRQEQADEGAPTGRTAPVGGGAKLSLGVPMLTSERVQVLGLEVGGLERVVSWTQDVTGLNMADAAGVYLANTTLAEIEADNLIVG